MSAFHFKQIVLIIFVYIYWDGKTYFLELIQKGKPPFFAAFKTTTTLSTAFSREVISTILKFMTFKQTLLSMGRGGIILRHSSMKKGETGRCYKKEYRNSYFDE